MSEWALAFYFPLARVAPHTRNPTCFSSVMHFSQLFRCAVQKVKLANAMGFSQRLQSPLFSHLCSTRPGGLLSHSYYASKANPTCTACSSTPVYALFFMDFGQQRRSRRRPLHIFPSCVLFFRGPTCIFTNSNCFSSTSCTLDQTCMKQNNFSALETLCHSYCTNSPARTATANRADGTGKADSRDRLPARTSSKSNSLHVQLLSLNSAASTEQKFSGTGRPSHIRASRPFSCQAGW